jgi:beta-lactamase regulating signal transducer with metallopeptidase domain
MIILLYITKVFIASGILFGYYWLFLRNKKFHHYNRFYLLAALIVPIVISFISIPVFSDPGNTVREVFYQTITTISTEPLHQSDSSTAITSGNEWGWKALFTVAYLLVCLVLFVIMLRTVVYIIKLRRRYPFESINQLRIYDTGEPGTPFSFFQSIFWNRELQLESKEGQQIFRHELFHVQQKHSADILFAEFISSIFWINPFFHIIKKELRAIHEFLADQYAVKNEDSTEYAQLLVQRILQSRTLAGSNYFFQTHIKRRIAMITQLKNKKYGYWSRLMVLPVTVLLFCGIALYAGQSPAQTTANKKAPAQKTKEKVITDTIPEAERKKLKAEFEELQVKKRELEEAHQKELDEVRYKQKLLLEKMGTEKEMEKALLEKEQKLMIERDIMEKKLLHDQNEKMKTDELLNLKLKMLSEQQGAGNEKVMELQKLKLSQDVYNKIQLQQNQLLLDKMKYLKEYQLDKVKQNIILEKKMKELLSATNQNKMQELQKKQLNDVRLKMLLEQKQLALKESDEVAQKLILKKQSELYDQNLKLTLDNSFPNDVIRYYNKNLRYPQDLLNVNKEGFVYVSIELNDKGELKDYIIHNAIPFTDGRKIYEIVVVSYAKNKIAESSGKVDYQELLNKEVERVTKKYTPGTDNVKNSSKKIFLRIVFKLEQNNNDKLQITEPD